MMWYMSCMSTTDKEEWQTPKRWQLSRN